MHSAGTWWFCATSAPRRTGRLREGFRRLGLGKVIGTRTWGGEVWLSLEQALTDRGAASAAELGVYGPEGTWLIEGHGVDPDIVVDNPPHATFAGGDAQLEAAIDYLKRRWRRSRSSSEAPPTLVRRAGKVRMQLGRGWLRPSAAGSSDCGARFSRLRSIGRSPRGRMPSGGDRRTSDECRPPEADPPSSPYSKARRKPCRPPARRDPPHGRDRLVIGGYRHRISIESHRTRCSENRERTGRVGHRRRWRGSISERCDRIPGTCR